jgi:tRNA A-37 threonylcarbamoyl transferase component Bud32
VNEASHNLNKALPTREDIEAGTTVLLKRSRSVWQPDTYLMEHDGIKYVIKDMRQRPLLLKLTWGRFVLKREIYALKKMKELPISPQPLGFVDCDALVMSYVDCKQLPKRLDEEKGNKYFEALRKYVQQMHDIGVTHGDLRRTNLLINSDGHPVIIDFASATVRSANPLRLLNRLMYFIQHKVDNNNIDKLYYVILENKKNILRNYPWYMKIGRFFRKGVYGKYKQITKGSEH